MLNWGYLSKFALISLTRNDNFSVMGTFLVHSTTPKQAKTEQQRFVIDGLNSFPFFEEFEFLHSIVTNSLAEQLLYQIDLTDTSSQ